MTIRISVLMCTLLTCVLGTVAAEGAGDFLVVVHPENPVESLSQKEVSDIFLKRTPTWPGGEAVLPVDLHSESSLREDFSREVHGREVKQVKSYWQRQIFSGRAVPPPQKGTEAEVLAFVRSNPGAIGYVSPGSPIGGLRLLTITE